MSRVVRELSLVLLGYLLLVLQSSNTSLLQWDPYVPDLVLMCILYTAQRRPLVRGLVVTLILGSLMDLFAGSPFGLYLFTDTVVFLFVRVVMAKVIVGGWLVRMPMALGACILQGGLLLLCITLFLPSYAATEWLAGRILVQALATVLFALPVHFIALRMDRFINRYIPQPL